jgi:hypothetical protein
MKVLKYLVFLLLSSLLLVPSTVNAEEVYVKSYTVERNETIVVPIYVNVSENIIGLDVMLKFNPNIVVAQDVRLNGSYQCKAGCFWFKNVGNDFVKVALIDTNGIKAKGIPVIDVVFKVIGNPGDSTELKLYANLSDSNYRLVKPTTSNGYVTIAGQPSVATTPTTTTTTTTATTTTTTTTATITTTATTTTVTTTTVTATTVTATATTTTTTATTTVATTTTTSTTISTTVTTAITKTTVTSKVKATTTTPQVTAHQHAVTTTQMIEKTTTATVVENETAKVVTTKGVDGFNILLCVLSAAIALILRKRG